jgi:hypothetical protein
MNQFQAPSAKLPAGLLTSLAMVQRRPAMFLPYDGQNFERALEGLETFIGGFFLALDAHQVTDRGADLYAGFPDWLAGRSGWKTDAPIRMVRLGTVSAAQAWATFWQLLWEYCDSKPGSTAPA